MSDSTLTFTLSQGDVFATAHRAVLSDVSAKIASTKVCTELVTNRYPERSPG
jgi:hypothetical protein